MYARVSGVTHRGREHPEVRALVRRERLADAATVVLPSSVPFLITGAAPGLGRALVGVVVGELYAATAGVGYLITVAGATFQTDKVFVGVLIITFAGRGPDGDAPAPRGAVLDLAAAPGRGNRRRLSRWSRSRADNAPLAHASGGVLCYELVKWWAIGAMAASIEWARYLVTLWIVGRHAYGLAAEESGHALAKAEAVVLAAVLGVHVPHVGQVHARQWRLVRRQRVG